MIGNMNVFEKKKLQQTNSDIRQVGLGLLITKELGWTIYRSIIICLFVCCCARFLSANAHLRSLSLKTRKLTCREIK